MVMGAIIAAVVPGLSVFGREGGRPLRKDMRAEVLSPHDVHAEGVLPRLPACALLLLALACASKRKRRKLHAVNLNYLKTPKILLNFKPKFKP